MIECVTCGAANPDGSVFCNACGSQLEPSTERETRKTVTVVFCDVAGSTSMGEQLDPETLRRLMTRYFEASRRALEHHGGTVEKFIGDAVMAVFGVPTIHEDDALRAVRAAVTMRDAIGSLSKELERDHGASLVCRIGVNTGDVVAGSGDQAIVTGDTVNVAARLEQVAPPGEILIGGPTFLLVRDAVTADPVEALEVKGKAEPIRAYRLESVSPGAAGFARHLDAPMVGRERELSLLRDAFERSISDRSCQLFTVIGVGGVGKTRLMSAFVEGLGDRATVLRGRCLPYGEGITYWPLTEALIEVAGLSEADSPDDARAKLADLVGPGEHTDRVAGRVGQAIGIAGSETAPEETMWAVRVLLEAMAVARPVVFVIDDLQWAEPTLLELVEYIADLSRDAPILLACMARPELLETWPAWGGGTLNATSILLEPLSHEETEALVVNLLADDAVDARVRARIAEAAEGHPLYAEEMTGLLVDEGRLALRDGRWMAASDLIDVHVPPTISALLAARLDRLPTDERRVVDVGSVMGQVFYAEAVSELAGLSAADCSSSLGALTRKQFVRPERSDVPGSEAVAFRHLLIRDAAYEALPKAGRADLHEWVADWLERATTPGIGEQDEVLGYHLESAFRYRTELGQRGDSVRRIAERASVSLRRAGRRSWDRADVTATANLLRRSLELGGLEPPEQVHALLQLGRALRDMGDLTGADERFAQAERVAGEIGDEVLSARARVVRVSWGQDLRAGRYWDPVLQGETGRDALQIFEPAGDDEGMGLAWSAIAGASWSSSRADLAADAWLRAADHFRLAGDRRNELEALEWLASAPTLGPTHVAQATAEVEAVLERVRGSFEAETGVRDTGAWLLVMSGELDEARDIMELRRRTLLELGSREYWAFESQSLGWLELVSGNADRSAAIFEEARRTLEEMGSPASYIIAAFLAQALYRLDRSDEAASHARFAAGGDLSGVVMAKGVLSRLLARRDRFDEALAMQREAIEMIEASDFTNDRADARMDLAEVYGFAGRIEDARTAAEDAIALFDEKGNVLQASNARAWLAKIS